MRKRDMPSSLKTSLILSHGRFSGLKMQSGIIWTNISVHLFWNCQAAYAVPVNPLGEVSNGKYR